MRRRHAFTLIELLVTVTIIAILAAAGIGALHAAREAAREAQTKSTVAKLDAVIVDAWEAFQTRRLPVTAAGLAAYAPLSTASPREQMEAMKWNLKRDLWRIELPDRWPDVLNPALCLPAVRNGQPRRYPLQEHYRRCYQRAFQNLTAPPPGRNLTVAAATKLLDRWEQAETLYMVVKAHDHNETHWLPREISDRDNDGLKEFVDGWGLPLMFLRWPAGWPTEAEGPVSSARGIEGLGPYPLVMSAGSDGLYDVNRGVEPDGSTYVYGLDFADNLNPWTLDENAPPTLIGEPVDATGPDGESPNGYLDHFDNVCNKRLD